MATHTLRIDVWFDLICPWCWIGKARLDQARQMLAACRPDVELQVHWHSVQLISDMPPQGIPYKAFYERRLGGAEAVAMRQLQVQKEAGRAGLQIAFEHLTVFPHTAAAHHLLAQAAAQLPGTAFETLLQALFSSYFQSGANLGEDAFLSALAQQHGVDRALPVPEPLPGEAWLKLAPPSGVPFFVVDRKVALSGAQSAEAFLAVMLRALDNAPAETVPYDG